MIAQVGIREAIVFSMATTVLQRNMVCAVKRTLGTLRE